MATDARGHTVPSGNDFAQRKSLTDLSLSIPSIETCSSPSAANLYLSLLADAGIIPTAADPAFVYRTDLEALTIHDGSGWSRLASKVGAANAVSGSVTDGIIIFGGTVATQTNVNGDVRITHNLGLAGTCTVIAVSGDTLTYPGIFTLNQSVGSYDANSFVVHATVKNANVRVNYILIGYM